MMRWILCLVCAVWPLATTADGLPPVLPALYEVVGVAADDQLNIRATPDAAAEVIGALAYDRTAVEVVAFSTAGGWAMVNHQERAGWVAARFLQRSAPVDGPLGFSARNLTCFGTEPFWSMQITDGRVVLSTPDSLAEHPVTAIYGSGAGAFAGGNTVFFDWSADGVPVRSHILPGLCNDGMSDLAFGLHYIDDAFGHRGCCSLY